MHAGARDKVLICCPSINTHSLFLFLFSPWYKLSSNEFLYSDNRPAAGSQPSSTLAFTVLVGLSEGYLILFHLQMLADAHRCGAGVNNIAGPAIPSSSVATHHEQMISCLDCQGEELFIIQVGLRGLHTKYLKITLARQNLSQSH